MILDRSYREIARFPAGNGRQSDLHEFLITPRNTALVTSYEMRTMDLSAFGGEAAGTVVGGIVQELEIPSARVLFEWRSLDHVPLEESHATAGDNFFDYFHVNSIDIDGDGDLLVSARNTWAVYKIGRKSGDVLWRLGGKQSDFAMGEGTASPGSTTPATIEGGRRLTIFDDGGAPTVEPQSRALLISLDTEGRRATLVRQYAHHPRPPAVPLHGQRAGARQRQRRRRLGQRAVHHRVQRRRLDPLRGEAAARRPELPRASGCRGRAAPPRSRSSSRTARPG